MPTNDSSHTSAEARGAQMHGPLARAFYFWGFVLAALCTLVALVWAIENWRGARAWSVVKHDLVARGEPLTIGQLVPPMPPADQNFATTPLLVDLLNYVSGAGIDRQAQARASAIALPPTKTLHSGRSFESSAQGRRDLMSYALGIRLRPRTCPPNLDPALAERYGYLPPNTKWKKPTNEVEIAASIHDPAQEVLDYLHRFDPELDEIAESARRPHSQFAVHYEEGYEALLPHLAPVKGLTTTFSVRSAARLAKQDTNGAFADAMTCLRLAHTIDTEALLISQLVQMGQHAIAVKTIWEGLVTQRWNTQQLAAFQAELARFNFQKQVLFALRGERVAQNYFFDHFSHMARASLDAFSNSEVRDNFFLLLIQWVPGWIRQNQVRVNHYDDIELRQITNPRWPANAVGALDQQPALRSAGLTKDGPYTLLTHLLTPDITKVQTKGARAQTINQLAMVACGLERFRLAHGTYPKELSELTSAELPGSSSDPMTGTPLRYERVADQSASGAGFRLWSVGMNGRDDGGIMPEHDNGAQGDWVWPEPEQHKAVLF